MRSAAAATALGITLLLAGVASCAGPDDPVQPPDPDPSATPVFASDEEALAAAEELYGRYLDISNAIGAAGWVDPARFSEVARDRTLDDELANAGNYSEKGYRQIGESTFDSMTLQQLTDHGRARVRMTVYLCLDVSQVDVVDAQGHSAVSPDRLDRQPLEVGIDDIAGALKVSRSETWSGADFC